MAIVNAAPTVAITRRTEQGVKGNQWLQRLSPGALGRCSRRPVTAGLGPGKARGEGGRHWGLREPFGVASAHGRALRMGGRKSEP